MSRPSFIAIVFCLVGSNLAWITETEEIESIIRRLRCQTGRSVRPRMPCDVFNERDSPACELWSMKERAIPKLVENLTDLTPTYAVWQSGDSLEPLTIGDCCYSILHQISGRTFCGYSAGIPLSSLKLSEVQHEARLWAKDLQSLGFKEGMRRDVVSGERYSSSCAKLFVEYWPSESLGVIQLGIAAAVDVSCKEELANCLDRLAGIEVSDYLLTLLDFDSPPGLRVCACALLSKRGVYRFAECLDDFPANFEARHVVRFIAVISRFGKCSDIESLLSKYPFLLPETKCELLHGLFSHNRISQRELRMASFKHWLRLALADQNVCGMAGFDQSGRQYRDPRICDMLADYLSKVMGIEFNLADSLLDRNKQILSLYMILCDEL